MPATNWTGQLFSELPQTEGKVLTFSTDIRTNATKAFTISPYEKFDLKLESLTVPLSQSRPFYRKRKFNIIGRARETDFGLIQQLIITQQQPIQAWLQMADGTYASFVKNGTTQTTQIVGNATGTNLGVNHWKFLTNDSDRYIDIDFHGQLAPAENRKLLDARAAALTGIAVQMKSLGVQATSTNGLGSIQIPGFNSYASVQGTNSGGTAILGNLGSGNEFTMEAAAGPGPKMNDEMEVYDRVMVNAKFFYLSVSIASWRAFEDSMSEACEYDVNFANSDVIKLVNCIQANSTFNMGTSAYDVEVVGAGHIMCNPDDSVISPQPNINVDTTSGANVITLNLKDN
jgi:hypothetical protein